MNIGQLIATLEIDARLEQATLEYDRFSRDIQNKTNMINSSLKKTGDQMVRTGKKLSLFVTAPIVVAGTFAVKMASDYVESVNKVDVAFGKNAAEVKKWSNTTLTSLGLARGSALDMAALFGDMATSMGYATDEAADMSKNLVSLAADLASFKNIQIGVAQTALSGVFTGETESLKRLGIVMTQVNLQEYALRQGIQKRIQDMNQVEKVQLRYNYIMEVTKNAQGDFARTSESTANQLRMFKESLKEVADTFGQVLLPIITPMIKNLNEMLKRIKNLTEEKKKWIITIGAVAAAIGPLLIILGTFIGGIIPRMITGITTVIKLFKLLRLAMITNPITAVAVAVTSLILIIGKWIRKTKDMTDAQKDLNEELTKTSREALRQYLTSVGLITKQGGFELINFDPTKIKSIIDSLPIAELQNFRSIIQDEITELLRTLGKLEQKYKDLPKFVKDANLSWYKEQLDGLKKIRSAIDKEVQYIDNLNKKTILASRPSVPGAISSPSGFNIPSPQIPKTLGSPAGTEKTLKDLNDQLQLTNDLEKALGDRFDVNAAKSDLLYNALENLIEQGYSPTSDAIQSIIDQMDQIDNTFPNIMRRIAETASTVASALSSVFTQIGNYLNTQMQNELQHMEQLAKNSHKSQQWIAEQSERIQKEYAKKQQQLAITQAIINTALGVTQALAQGGLLGIATGSLVAAAGAIEIASIRRQKFAEGGQVPPGFPNDSYPAWLSSGEKIIPAGKSLPELNGGQLGSKEDIEKLIETIENKKETHVHIDNYGIAVTTKQGNVWNNYINKKFNRKS